MSANSAALKGLSITVAGAAVALSAGEAVGWLLVVVALFALCDAGYLRMERDFRALYRLVAARPLDAAADMHINRPTGHASAYVGALTSWSVGAFHAIVAFGILLMEVFAHK